MSAQPSASEGFLARLALKLAGAPKRALLASLGVTAITIPIALGLSIDPKIQSLIPKESSHVAASIESETDFEHTEYVTVVIEIPSNHPPRRYRRFIEEYKRRLSELPEVRSDRLNLTRPLFSKIRKYFEGHGLLLLDEEALEEIDRRVSPEALSQPDALKEPFQSNLPSQIFDPLKIRTIIQPSVPILQKALPDESGEFFISRDPHVLFFFLSVENPWAWNRIKELVDQAKRQEEKAWQATISEVQRLYPDQTIPRPEVNWVGKHMNVLRTANAIWGDFKQTMLLSFLLVGLLFLTFFRNPKALFLSYLPLILGMIWTFAFARVAIGELNALSILTGTVLIGVGINSPIYLLDRFYRYRQRGDSFEQALATTWEKTGRTVCIAVLTTCLGFFALAFSRLPAFRDTGLIAGIGLILILISSLVVLPALLRLIETKQPKYAPMDYPRFLVDLPLKRPMATAVVGLIFFGVLGYFLTDFRWFTSYKEAYVLLREPGEVTSAIDQRFASILESSITPFRFIVEGKSWEEALEKNDRLAEMLNDYRRRGKISGFDSLYYWLPSRPRQERLQSKIKTLGHINSELFSANYKAALSQVSRRRFTAMKYNKYGKTIAAFLSAYAPTSPEVLVEEGLQPLLDQYSKKNGDTYRLSTYVYLPRGDFAVAKQDLMESLLQEEMFRRRDVFHSSGEAIIAEIKTILTKELVWMGGALILLIFLILLVGLKSVRIALLSLIPMAIGGIAAVGGHILILGSASIFVTLWIPVYLGMSTDDAVHLSGSDSNSLAESLRTNGNMIALSSLTQMIGCGTGIFSALQMSRQISVYLFTAMGCELIASLILLPALLTLTSPRTFLRLEETLNVAST